MRAARITRFLLIIGAMKCGTTSLFRHLARHPEICAASDKEPGFFAFDYRWSKGLDYYEGLFDFDPKRHLWALEASTDYTKRPHCLDVAANMLALKGAEYRLIYVMRNPLRRIESHARHVARTGREIGRYSLEQAYSPLDDGVSKVALDVSRYAYQLEPFIEAFGRERIYLTTTERFNADPAVVIAEIFAFAGLAPIAIDASRRFNEAAALRAPTKLWKLARELPLLRSAYRSVVPKSVHAALWNRFSREKGRFTLTDEEEARVLDELRDDLDELSPRYGIDVEGIWGIRRR